MVGRWGAPRDSRDRQRAYGAGSDDGGDDATRLLGLCWVCAELAERTPLLLVIDDAQWANLPSLRFLDYLARRVTELPVLSLAAREAPPDEAVGRLLAPAVGAGTRTSGNCRSTPPSEMPHR